MFSFEIIHQSKKSRARVGRITTPHGVIDTPGFVPVGTNAAIKAVDSRTVEELAVQLMFANTYHLLLHPGPDVVQQAGGLHTFMNRKQPIITDSGGFQVFSLAYGGVASELKSRGQKKYQGAIKRLNEEGVTFRSYRDGQLHTLTPESSVHIQKALGADIILPLDELLPYHVSERELKKSFDRTHRWEQRSWHEHEKNIQQQAMYAIIHGGIDHALRKESARILTQTPFDGFAIGGSLGKNRTEMVDMLTSLMPHIPPEKPNHLLGIGDTPSIDACIPQGIDTFDSSYPTKAARHGVLFTWDGSIKIKSGKWKYVFEPVSNAPICKEYSAAYLHHLFKSHEPTMYTLATIHNLHFMMEYMHHYRTLIMHDKI